jgi:hypothetical protein
MRGAALKAFSEIGLSAAVRAVLSRALVPDTTGLRSELQADSSTDLFVQQMLGVQRQLQEVRGELQTLTVRFEARTPNGIMEMTRQAGGARFKRRQQELLRRGVPLPAGDEGVQILNNLQPLSCTQFLADMLEPEQHYVIQHLNPIFSKELLRHKLRQSEELQEGFFLTWKVGAWRVLYTERDRELMEQIFFDPVMSLKLTDMLRDCAPFKPPATRPGQIGSFRPGPEQQIQEASES